MKEKVRNMSKVATLTLTCQKEMDCPKEIVMWNYYDHEHLVGTHYKLYDHARVIAEKGDWALVYRSKKTPFLPIRTGGLALQRMEGNVMKTVHQDHIGFILEMEVKFDDLPNDRCLITTTYNINTHPIFKIFDPIFKMIFKKWFEATWDEDAPMRLRRWKVHKLGFKDFYGIDYINKKQPKPEKINYPKYEFKPPVKCFSTINTIEGFERPFSNNPELGYND